jgi:hypothetical protein
MKSEFFLALPVAATVFNIFFALQLNHAHSKVDAQPVVVNEAYIDRCLDNSLDERYLSLDDYRKDDAEDLAEDKDDLVDPMLQPMPETDFEAYVRSDIATFMVKSQAL